MSYQTQLNVTSDRLSGFERLRVDPGQTGFFEGRQFRAYVELNVPVGGSLSARFTAASDFILTSQELTLDFGGLRLEVFIGATPSGVWTTVPQIGVNRMNERRKRYDGTYYTSTALLEQGGSFTGGTVVDLIRVRTSSQNVGASNVSQGQESERGLPAGVYFIRLTPLSGVNDTSTGVYSIAWEERVPGGFFLAPNANP